MHHYINKKFNQKQFGIFEQSSFDNIFWIIAYLDKVFGLFILVQQEVVSY